VRGVAGVLLAPLAGELHQHLQGRGLSSDQVRAALVALAHRVLDR
jgi:hypothetical protein